VSGSFFLPKTHGNWPELANFVIMRDPVKLLTLIPAIILAGLIHLHAQQDIARARALGSGATVTVSGVVTNGEELGTIRYMQDHTAGIAVYSTEMSGVQRGDSVTVTGTLKD